PRRGRAGLGLRPDARAFLDGTRRFAQHITPDPGGSALTSGLGGRPSGFDGSTSAHIWAAHIWAYGPLYALSALGALSPENLAKPRPKPPFDLTGTWQHELRGPQSWKFVPPAFELTPEAQVHYEAGRRAAAEGKVYRDDIGQCWPAGMPLIMTRVHPF